MKNVLIIFVSILLLLAILSTYVFLNFPNKEKIKEKIKDNYSENITPEKSNIEKLSKKTKETSIEP